MSTPYRLSFTTGGLFITEAPVVVACYLTHLDWTQARDQVRQDKLLQVRTDTAATRISKEIVARLELLTHAELQALAELNLRDRAYLLWVAACRRYRLIHDFAVEVLREHPQTRRPGTQPRARAGHPHRHATGRQLRQYRELPQPPTSNTACASTSSMPPLPLPHLVNSLLTKSPGATTSSSSPSAAAPPRPVSTSPKP